MNTPSKIPPGRKNSNCRRAVCPQCKNAALVKGRYDAADGDSIPWAYCTRCPYSYEG
jgi:hypothetical protein